MDWLTYLFYGVGALTYLFVGMLCARRQYIRIYTDYLRWKMESPETPAYIYQGGFDVFDPPPKTMARKNVAYTGYMTSVNREIQPWLLIPLWLPIMALGMAYGFIHPTVELPNDLKIKELESDLARMDEEWKTGSGEDG